MCCQQDFISILALERLKLPLDHTQPVICIQGVAGSGKGGRLCPQKSCQLVIHGLLSRPPVYAGIGQCFQYEGLVVNYLCQVSEGWWWWQWHFLIFLRFWLTSCSSWGGFCPLGCPPAPAAAGVRLREALVPLREAICRLDRVFVRLRLELSDV